MHHHLKKTAILLALLLSLICLDGYSQTLKLPLDGLVANVSAYVGKKVEVEGVVAHICGVDGRKMKIVSDKNSEVEVIPNKKLGALDFGISKKRVRVWGVVKEVRIDNAFADKMERDQALLCSIDQKPCKDSAWVERKRKTEAAAAQSKQSIAKLRERIAASGKGYLSIAIVVADKVEVVE